MESLPIGEYALLSDCRSAALVSREGSVDWLCVPRFDGPSVFCRLLDPAGGHFAIRPAGEFQVSRRYMDQTLVLETTFSTERGTAVLIDALAVGRKERGHHLGAHSPGMLLRSLVCTRGEIQAAGQAAVFALGHGDMAGGHWPRGLRRRSPASWTTPWRAGGPGR
jgi:GH15 family glucan-1,4-alpha-glucosidase